MSDLAAAAAARAASRATRTITTRQIDLALSWARGEITLADAEKLIGKTGPPYPLLARSLAEAVRSGRLVEGVSGERSVDPQRGWCGLSCTAIGCQRELGHAGPCGAPFTSQTEK